MHVATNPWFKYNYADKKYYDVINIKREINPLSGHHYDHIAKPRLKKCRKCCRQLLSRFAKNKLINGIITGLCGQGKHSCWQKKCNKKKWYCYLSYRANEICDALNIVDRKQITKDNITQILNLPDQYKYLHFCPKKTKKNNVAISNKTDVDSVSNNNYSTNTRNIMATNNVIVPVICEPIITDNYILIDEEKDDYIINCFIENMIC